MTKTSPSKPSSAGGPSSHDSSPLPVSRATDILTHPTKSALPRYAAYTRARARFWEAFPSGLYVRLPTPGTDLECGLYAIVLSMRELLHQQGQRDQQEGQVCGSGVKVERVPTLGELREIGRELGLGNENWFGADQLAAIFSAWGKKFLRVEGDEGKKTGCQLGWVTDPDLEMEDEGWPVMMNTPEVDTDDTGEDIVRVWIWNDGASMRGGVGHFEGIRRPTAGEIEAMGRKEEEPSEREGAR